MHGTVHNLSMADKKEAPNNKSDIIKWPKQYEEQQKERKNVSNIKTRQGRKWTKQVLDYGRTVFFLMRKAK